MKLQDSFRKMEKSDQGSSYMLQGLFFFHFLLLGMFISSSMHSQEIKVHKLSNDDTVRRMQVDSIYLSRSRRFEKSKSQDETGGDIEVKLTALIQLKVRCGAASNYAVLTTLNPGDEFIVTDITPEKWLEVWFSREHEGNKVAYRGYLSQGLDP